MTLKASTFMSFLGLWISLFLSNNQEFLVGFFLILSFGILHGANDFLIIDKLKLKDNFKKKLIYLLSIIIFIVLFYNYPNLCITSFLITSSFHFGEQHFIDLEIKNEKYHLFHKFFLGYFILNILFVNNKRSVIIILNEITTLKIDEHILVINFILSIILFILFTTNIVYKRKMEIEKLLQFLLSLIVLYIIFRTSSLIWGFTIYFVFWHSIPSMFCQIKYVYNEINYKNFFHYTQNAILYWILAISCLFLFFFYFRKNSFFISSFFIFISSITFPHAFVIIKMFKQYTKSSKKLN